MKKKIREWRLMGLTSLMIFTIRFLTEETVSIKYGEIIYLISLSLLLFALYMITRRRWSNMSLFFTLTFLLLGLLPYCHYLHYSSNRKNYSFNKEYLMQNAESYKLELKDFSDSTYISEIHSKYLRKPLNVIIEDSLLNKVQKVENYYFIIRSTPYFSVAPKPLQRPNDRGFNILEIYKNNKLVSRFPYETNDIQEDINRYLIRKNLVHRKIKNPEQFIPFNDIWLDSVTGFVFSFIKPLSKISQLIRLIQIITAYFLFYMISSWLKLSKELNIVEKKN